MPAEYTQNPKMALLRSYVEGIEVGNTWSGISMTDNVITLFGTVPFLYYNVYVINPLFFPWTSNTYTLDYVFTDIYGLIPPDPTHIPIVARVEFIGMSNGLPNRMLIREVRSDVQRTYFELPPSPTDYWLNHGQ